jgi:hypothetical protein
LNSATAVANALARHRKYAFIFVETMEDDNNQISTISSSISAAVLRLPLEREATSLPVVLLDITAARVALVDTRSCCRHVAWMRYVLKQMDYSRVVHILAWNHTDLSWYRCRLVRMADGGPTRWIRVYRIGADCEDK